MNRCTLYLLFPVSKSLVSCVYIYIYSYRIRSAFFLLISSAALLFCFGFGFFFFFFFFLVLASDVLEYFMLAFCCTFKCFDWRLFIYPLKLFVALLVMPLHSVRNRKIKNNNNNDDVDDNDHNNVNYIKFIRTITTTTIYSAPP